MEHEIINHRYLKKGKCYDTADVYRHQTLDNGNIVYFTNSPTTYIGQYVGNSWDHTMGPAPLIYYFKDRDGRINSLTHFEDPWLYFREVPCPPSNVLDEYTNNKKIPTLENLALKEVLNNISTSEIKNLPIGNNININTDTDNPYASEPLIDSVEWQKNRVRPPLPGGKKYIKKSRKIRKIRKIRKSKKIRKSRKSRKSKY
jgi:hypothetical protein